MKKDMTYPWVVVGLLWVVGLLNYMDRQMLSTMRPFLEGDIPEVRSAASFGYLMAIFLWVYAVANPVAGFLADRVSRKRLIVAGLMVWSGVTFGMAYARSYHVLYLFRAVMGVSEALYIPAARSLIAASHGERTRSLAIGIHMTGLYAGVALGGFGATVAAALSWQATFRIFGCAGVAYAVVLAVFLRDQGSWQRASRFGFPRQRLSFRRLRGLRRQRLSFRGHGITALFSVFAFWVLLFCFAAGSLPGWAVKNWLPTLFSVNLHAGMAEAGPLATISIALSSLVGVLFGGILSDRWVQVHRRARVFTGAIGLGLTIPSLLLLGVAGSMWLSVLVALCFGVGFGMFDANNMPLVCQLVPENSRATAYGLMNTAGVIAGAVVTGSLGRSMDAGHLGQSFALLSIFVLAAVVLMLGFLHPRRPADASPSSWSDRKAEEKEISL